MTMSRAHWQHYSHPADMGIRGFGASMEEAFEQAAMALTAIITDLKKVEPRQMIEIICQEQDNELLFVGWLNALLYEMATRHMLFSRFELEIKDGHLSAKAWGEKIDIKRHSPAVEVKAATCADLKVGNDGEGNWLAQCVVDV
jgi:SHS2 domain-containing protein